jgi:DNA-nicking Smr family endonuclease
LPKRPREPVSQSPPAKAEEEEARLFREAASGAVPLRPGPQRVHHEPRARLPDPAEEDREVRAQLEALVRGEAAFELSDTAEFLEGAVADLDRRTRQKLRRGELAIQGHIDLHGMTRDEAKVALEAFVIAQHDAGHRVVLVVHGRGRNSKDGVPVLKERMAPWLSRGPLGRRVLAFCSARPSDGGTGALYVLLRKA